MITRSGFPAKQESPSDIAGPLEFASDSSGPRFLHLRKERRNDRMSTRSRPDRLALAGPLVVLGVPAEKPGKNMTPTRTVLLLRLGPEPAEQLIVAAGTKPVSDRRNWPVVGYTAGVPP